MPNENPQPELKGMAKTAYDDILTRQPEPSQCYDWAMENIEQLEDLGDDGEVYEVQLSWKQWSAVEEQGFIKRTEKVFVQKFPDDRENIIVTR